MAKLKIINLKNEKQFDDFLSLYKNSQHHKLSKKVAEQLRNDFFKNKLFKIIIGYIDSEIAGFIILIDSYSSTFAKKTCYIEEFYIKQALQNQGFGRQFFQYLIKYARKNKYIRLEWSTQKNNKKAVDFYKKYNPDNNWLFYKLNL